MDFVPWKKQAVTQDSFENDGSYPAFFAEILATRGFASTQQARGFIEQTAPQLHDPMLLRDMDKAVTRIHAAIAEGHRILVYGDYDCDGVTSTVMLYDYLENAGADVLYYIPQREGEGYGLNLNAIERIHDEKVALIITVDNGISSVDEIAKATEYGIDVIVTDHHRPKEALPQCVAVIDPHWPDCDYPFKGLCGAGVVFKLICALEQDTDGLLLEQYGDLLAIATMADIVPLVDENRAMVRTGLVVLQNTERVGIVELAKAAGIELASITSEQICFGLAPRINVTGRIALVDLAVELLLTQDEDEARKLSGTINTLNQQRKDIEAEIVADIGKLLAAQPQLTAARVLVVSGKGWHPGVIGITAARLVERYRKPCIILTEMENGELRGSARSIEGFSIIEAIDACAQHLVKYGGHPMAAGLTVQAKKLDGFLQALADYSLQRHPDMPRYQLTVDCDLQPGDVTLENITLLDSLQPFGCANPQPVPVLCGMTLLGITPIGGGNHLRLALGQGGKKLEAVLFGTTPEAFPLPIGCVVDCAVSLSKNSWQGVVRPSVRVVSMVPQGFDALQKLRGQELFDRLRRGESIDQPDREPCLFGRADLSATFRLLREQSPYRGGSDWLLHRLGVGYGSFRLLVSLEILVELGLISTTREKTGLVYTVLPSEGKVNLADAPTYQRLAALQLTRAE